MDINTEITNQSWGNLGDDVAKNYLHYRLPAPIYRFMIFDFHTTRRLLD